MNGERGMNVVRTAQIRKRSMPLWALGAVVGMVSGVVGCGSEDSPAPFVGPVIAAPGIAAESNKSETPLGARPGSAEPTPKLEQVSLARKYNAPFPNRAGMFTPPRRKNIAVKRNNQRRDSAVELKGFVSPPGRDALAILAIDGIIQPVGVGEEKFGIKVVSIEQPQVTLQRGSSRWTESIE